jgi:hypothetical protein
MSIYEVSIYRQEVLVAVKDHRKMHRTSSPGEMSLITTTHMRGSSTALFLLVPGKTTTALGSHEWLIRAMIGDTQTPIGVSEGDVQANELVKNYNAR